MKILGKYANVKHRYFSIRGHTDKQDHGDDERGGVTLKTISNAAAGITLLITILSFKIQDTMIHSNLLKNGNYQ